jgi:hypothetical protein
MTDIQSSLSPIALLVLLLVCLAITGSFLAGVHYYAIDLPRQQALSRPPSNNGSGDDPGFFLYSPGYQGGINVPGG